jgi:hypothetical protein
MKKEKKRTVKEKEALFVAIAPYGPSPEDSLIIVGTEKVVKKEVEEWINRDNSEPGKIKIYSLGKEIGWDWKTKTEVEFL